MNLKHLDLGENEISDLSPLSTLSSLTHLNLKRNRISDLSPLSKLTNLEYLDLYNNKIVDITPLSLLINLKHLDLHNNVEKTGSEESFKVSGGIESIDSVKNMKKLEMLSLGSNNLKNADVIKNLPNIKDLVLGGNHISDFSELIDYLVPRLVAMEEGNVSVKTAPQGINYGKEVAVSSNKASIDNPYKGVIELGEKLGEALEFEGKLNFFENIEADVDGVSVKYDRSTNKINFEFSKDFLKENNGTTVTVNLDAVFGEEYDWKIKNIKLKVNAPVSEIKDKSLLKKLEGKDLSKVTELTNLSGVKDLSGLSELTNLKKLELNGEYNEVNDFSELAKLGNLEELSLENTKIKDLSVLSNLSKLKDLNLAGPFVDPEYSDVANPAEYVIKNIDALKNLVNLEKLSLANRGVEDVSTLENLTKLNDVVLSNNNISNINPLKNLVALTNLDLTSNKNIEDISTLKNLVNLENLWLTENKISNIDVLKGLTNLKKLYINVNNISDLSPLSGLTNLTHLSLGANNIENVKPLSTLVNLVSLRAADNKISDVSGLATLVNLTDLNLSNNKIHDYSPLNTLEKINKRRGFAKQLEEIKVEKREITIPTAKDFDGSAIDLIKNEDGSLVLYKVENKKGKNQPVVNDETEELVPLEKQYKVIAKDGNYVLPKELENGLYAVQWFKNYQQWGSFILDVNIKEDAPTYLNMSQEVKDFYKNLLNYWSDFYKKYTNLTDEANEKFVKNGKRMALPKAVNDNNFTASDFEMVRTFSSGKNKVTDEVVAPLKYATNLEEIKVYAKEDGVRKVTNWDFLKDLKKLKVFHYTNQNHTTEKVDVSKLDLTNNTTLEDVRVAKGNLTSLDFVKGLSLKQLDVEDNNITDISAIKDMTSLTELHLDNNKLTNANMKDLEKLVNIDTLYLKNNKEISDVSNLAVLKNIEAIELKNLSLSDINFLKDLPKLRRVVIDGNPLAKDYMTVIKELDINTGYLGEISKEDFEWLKKYAIRDEVEAINPENKPREFTFTKLPLTVEVKKSEIKDGKITIENPLKDWSGLGAMFDGNAPENMEISEETGDLMLTLGTNSPEVFKYAIYIEDYEHTYGDSEQPASVHGNVELTVNVVDDTVGEEVKIQTHGDYIKVDKNEVDKGEEVVVTLTPNEKSYPVSFKVNGEEKVNELKEKDNIYTFTFAPEKDSDIRVIYQETRKLTFVGEGLSVVGKNINKLNHGEEVRVKITPPEGKVVGTFTETNYNSHGEVALNGNNNTSKLQFVNDNEYIITNLDYDTVLKIEYVDKVTTPNAEDDFEFDARTGTIKEYKYGKRKDVIIPEAIGGVKVEHIGEYAFSGIDSVVLPKYLKTIGDQAFQSNNLKEVVIPEGVEEIGAIAFNNNKISKLVLPKSLKKIGAQAFKTNKLKEVVVPDGVEVLEKEVFAKNELEKITLPKNIILKGEGVFANNKLTNIELPSTVTEIPPRLFEENNLESIKIPEGVIRIGEKSFFSNKLTNIEVAESVKNIDNLAFANNKLIKVVLPVNADVYPTAFDENVETNIPKKELEVAPEKDFDFDKQTKTIKSYNGNSSIVKIPDTIDGVDVEHIGYSGNSWLKLGAFEYDQYEKPNKVYKVILPKNLKSIDEAAFKNSGLVEVIFPETLESIGADAFSGNKLVNVVLPESVKNIGENAFKDNTIVNINLENVENIGNYSFANNKLTTVTLNEKLATLAEGIFANNKLGKVVLSKNITEIGNNAFFRNELTSISIPNSVAIIGDNAFLGNALSGNLVIPESVTSIGTAAFSGSNIGRLEIKGSAEIKKRAFYKSGVSDVVFADGVNISGSEAFGFNPLVEVVIPSGTTKLGSYSFERNLLEKVILSKGLVTIGDGAFEVNNLKEVTIPGNVKEISTAAFFNNKITTLVLEDGVEKIGEGAFQKNKLESVNIPTTVSSIERGAFKENKITNVVLPQGTKNNDGFDEGVSIKNN